MIRNFELISSLIDQGRIRIGMTRAELHGLLGKSDEEGGTSRKYRTPCIYKYGVVQFVFPISKTIHESEQQGLQYVYVDDLGEIEAPLFLLQ